MSLIRKISVGLNYPDKALHYQVGKAMNLGGEPHEVTAIEKAVENGKVGYNVYICSQGGSSVLWKRIEDLPVVVEFPIDFE